MRKTFVQILFLFLSIKGRINFLQLSRFSKRAESSFRYAFEQSFDFLEFNKTLMHQHITGDSAIAFDPSYISKSGKSTPGVGYFWSGCEGRTKWGLEFNGLAILDVERHTAYHLEGFQTIHISKDDTLINFYTNNIIERKEKLLSISEYIVADAYFSKETFITPLLSNGFHVISRLRSDADLRYLYSGEKRKGRGRPKIYDGKIYYNELNLDHLKEVSSVDNERIYSGIVHSKSLNRKINLVVVYTTSNKGKETYKLYFSTDLTQIWSKILELYKLRFQIEFLYRDAKQFTGLNECEARSKNKLDFHWNMSLTALNVAKTMEWIPKNDKVLDKKVPFSMSDVKTVYNNELLLNQFISMFGINPELAKYKKKIIRWLEFGRIAA